MQIECFLTNLYSVDVMAPFCLEMKKRGYDCYLALDEMFWKLSYGEHFDIQKAVQKANEWGVKLNLRLNYDVDIAITQWRIDWALFGLYKNLKAKITYGVGLNKRTNSLYSEPNFDLYFVHGDFEKNNLISQGIEEKRIIKIGFPKLKYLTVNFMPLKTKKIITYLPTWDEFNCIDLAIDKLCKFSEFKIYVKPHPLQKQIDLKKLQKFNLLNKNVSIRGIVEFSDYIFADVKSGVIFDCIYYNPRKYIGLFSKRENLKYHYDLYKEFDDVITDDKEIEFKSCKDKTQLKEYVFSEDYKINLCVGKVSPDFYVNELEIFKQRLEKTYKEYYIV